MAKDIGAKTAPGISSSAVRVGAKATEGSRTPKSSSGARQFRLLALCLVVLLGLLFWDGFRPGHTVFSNDGPLGAISTQAARMPSGFFGYWTDLNWLGGAGTSASPDVSATLATIIGPLGFSRLLGPFSVLFVGLCAWFCFRQWKLCPLACFLGALATTLNSDFLSKIGRAHV